MQPVSEIVKVVDPTTFVRPIYAGNALATVKSKDSIILASVRASAFPPAEIGGATAPLSKSLSLLNLVTAHNLCLNKLSSQKDRNWDWPREWFLGAWVENKEMFDQLIDPLATKLNAAIGASRAAVDSGSVTIPYKLVKRVRLLLQICI